MKARKQIIIPIAIIMILAIYLIMNNTGKMNYSIPEFEVISEQEISSIKINGLSEDLEFYSDNGVWRFNSNNLRAETSKISEIISFLINPELIDMVSDTGNYYNYGLGDEEYISVQAWINNNSEGKPNRELLIGNVNTTGSFTFIRIPNRVNVFTVGGNRKELFDVKQDDMLDKKVLNIDIPNIDKLSFSFPDSEYIIEKTVGDNNDDIWITSNNLAIEVNNLKQNLRYLSNSRFDAYNNDVDTDFLNYLFKINLLGKNIDENFIISKKNDEGYYGKSSYAEGDFILSENSGTQIIKMFSELIEKKEK